MKKFFCALLFIGVLVSCQSAIAQPKPSITTKHINDKIKEMLTSFKIANSQDVITPPSVVSSKFNIDFPQARDIEWEVASGIYEVEFEIGYTDYKCYYTTDGDLLMYAFNINVLDIPAVVKNATIAKYPDYDFDDIKEIHRGTEVLFDIELKHRNIEVEMLILENGTILNEKFD